MILNFKTQINGVPTNFKEKILSGQKIHTIRKKGRWKAGDTIHFSTGARSKNYECFKTGTVVSVQNLCFKLGAIFIDDMICSLNLIEKQDLILNDGFDSSEEFWDWFETGGEFDLIHWTSKRY